MIEFPHRKWYILNIDTRYEELETCGSVPSFDNEWSSTSVPFDDDNESKIKKLVEIPNVSLEK
jgi:hypothetical protein